MSKHSYTVTVNCERCGVPLQGPSNPQPHDLLTCPKCGGEIETKKALEQTRKLVIAEYEKRLKEMFRQAGFK